MEFCSKKDNFKWCCITVYDPNVRALKHVFFGRSFRTMEVPLTFLGLFAMTLMQFLHLRIKSQVLPIWRAFEVLMQRLLEPPSVGRRDPIWVNLDCFIVNNAWACRFLKLIQNSLPKLGFDYVPVRLEVGNHCFNPRPFRYELAWSTMEGFQS